MNTATTSRQLKVSGLFLAAIYVVFGLGDYVLSLAAFRLGVPEGNPVLRWAAAHGTEAFGLAKMTLTLVAAVLIAVLSRVRPGRAVAWGGVLTMLLVNVCHIVALRMRLGAA